MFWLEYVNEVKNLIIYKKEEHCLLPWDSSTALLLMTLCLKIWSILISVTYLMYVCICCNFCPLPSLCTLQCLKKGQTEALPSCALCSLPWALQRAWLLTRRILPHRREAALSQTKRFHVTSGNCLRLPRKIKSAEFKRKNTKFIS